MQEVDARRSKKQRHLRLSLAYGTKALHLFLSFARQNYTSMLAKVGIMTNWLSFGMTYFDGSWDELDQKKSILQELLSRRMIMR